MFVVAEDASLASIEIVLALKFAQQLDVA